jgi:uncharacterized protein (TIGR02147 family)
MQSQSEILYYRKRLKEELAQRIEKNHRYSLRSFSTALGVGSGALSQILSGKRSISTKLIERIFSLIELSPLEQKKFLQSVMDEKKHLHRVSPALKNRLQEIATQSKKSTAASRSLGVDEFRVISDWYHTAILELTFAKDFKSDARWIANALQITPMEAQLAIDRLLQLELLEEFDGELRKTDFYLQMKDKTKTSVFLKRRQKQILDKSVHSLENDPIEERNHSARTLCIDIDHIPEAKIRIQSFIQELSQLLVCGEPNRVYELSVNLFPLQKKSSISPLLKTRKK